MSSVSRVNPRTPEVLLYNDVYVPGVEYIHCVFVCEREKSVSNHTLP